MYERIIHVHNDRTPLITLTLGDDRHITIRLLEFCFEKDALIRISSKKKR